MNLKSKGLGFAVVFIVGFFLLGRIALSEDDHAGHDHGLSIPVIKQESRAESDLDEHDHRAHKSDEVQDHAAHADHEDEEGIETDHEGHDHDDHDKKHSDSVVDSDDEGHDHGDEVESEHDGHGHGEKDHDDEVLELTDEQKREIGLSLAQAGPDSLLNEFSLMGEIRLNEDRVAHVVPKVPGVAKNVAVSLGERVQMGQVLATIVSAELAESEADYFEKLRQLEIARKAYKRKKYLHEEKIASEAGWLEKEAEYLNAEIALKTAKRRLIVSGLTEEEIKALQKNSYQFGLHILRAPISGTVIEKHITMGEKLSDESDVFTIADLSALWVDLNISSRDISSIKQGTSVVVQSSDGREALSTIFLIGPMLDEETRTGLARLMLDNTDRSWRPGTFVTGHVRVSAENLPVVVPVAAVQNIEGKDVIFVPEKHGFKPVPIESGRRDRTKIEIVAGLRPGTSYVMQGAFELKAITVTSSLGSHAGHGH